MYGSIFFIHDLIHIYKFKASYCQGSLKNWISHDQGNFLCTGNGGRHKKRYMHSAEVRCIFIKAEPLLLYKHNMHS